MAIEQNDMSLVEKAYTAITGNKILTPKTEQTIPNTTTLRPPQNNTSNLFVDDGSIASNDSPKKNANIAKLYNPPTQRREAAQEVTLQCQCGARETVSEYLAAQYVGSDPQVFKCQQCLVRYRPHA
jgi:hypothetical protein